MTFDCHCNRKHGKTKLIVITGGPGAGKTAVLELAKKQLCRHVAIFPEAASIIFGGGFWRLESKGAKKACQRAIFYVQKEMESLVLQEKKWAIGLCDRGTLDGLAYWPSSAIDFWKNVGSSKEQEYEKYVSVIHLRTPSLDFGYNKSNPIRIENAIEASKIDHRIAQIWKDHPDYHEINSTHNFLEKAETTLNLIAKKIPICCQP